MGCNEYKFEISGNAFVTPVEIIRTNVLLNLNQVPGIQTNQEYSIRVAAGFNGTFGNWGDPCIVRYKMNGSSIQRNDITNSVNEFEVSIAPNPFADVINIQFEGNSNEPIKVTFFDMLGRELLNEIVTTNNTSLGASLPNGVYTLIVEQNNNSKSFRVIKR